LVLWKPEIYQKIKILPDNIIENVPAEDEKVSCAGGVDSIFAILPQ
jgi:hypothetical protein